MATDPSARDDRRAAWSRYWAGGRLHSCGGSFDGNYDGPIRAFWQAAFATLRPGQRVLDIATGNGPLPRLLLDLRPDAAIDCDAVDLAGVAPAWWRELPDATRERLRFHAGVAAEALPFDDDRFDLVMSQYGIEYADLDAAVGEVLRVLAPGGRVRLLVHHAGSLPVALAADELAEIDWLVSPDGLLAAAAWMLAPMARSVTPEGRAALQAHPSAQAARAGFDAAQRVAQDRVGRSRCPDVLHEAGQGVAQAFGIARTHGVAAGDAALANMRQALADAALRLHELRTHALDADAVQALCRRFESAGITPARATPLSHDGRLMAWAIDAG